LEERIALVGDLALLTATMGDSRGVRFSYEVRNADITQPLQVAIFRSADNQADAGDVRISELTLSGADLAVGTHTLTASAAGGLPIDPARPFVVVAADPANAIGEADEANNLTSFRIYVVGAVTHGLEQSGVFPAWVPALADSLRAQGYDATIPFDWTDSSSVAIRGRTIEVGQRLAAAVLAAVQTLPADAVIDLHLIGEGRGAVVVSQAMLALEQMEAQGTIPQLRGLQAGFTKLTFLDPHPAHNRHDVGDPNQVDPDQNDPERRFFRFQELAEDPEVIVPGTVDAAEVYYQQAANTASPNLFENFFNLWGEVPIAGATHVCNLTGTVNSHSGVQVWYQQNVVPTLRTASEFVCPDTPPAPTPPRRRQGGTAYEAGLLSRALRINPRIANTISRRLSPALAAFQRGNNELGARRLNRLNRFIQSNPRIAPDGTAFLQFAVNAILVTP
jgi:hypothetical protein